MYAKGETIQKTIQNAVYKNQKTKVKKLKANTKRILKNKSSNYAITKRSP